MKNVLHIETIDQYNKGTDHPTLHPLVSIVDFSKAQARHKPPVKALSFGFYCVFLKEDKNCNIRYGRNYYDYQEGTLLFIAPGQVVSIEEDEEFYQPSGLALLFHPDLAKGTALASRMKDFTFFSYHVREALHLSDEERQLIIDMFSKIKSELSRIIDKHSRRLIAAQIELLLSYCVRFYDRQFITREQVNSSVLERFEVLLADQLSALKLPLKGIPSVAFFAEQLHLSPNYLGDLIKKDTGKTALDHIQARLIQLAKEGLYTDHKTVSEIAYELGFTYPQHFTRFFKKHTGQSPNTYRLYN